MPRNTRSHHPKKTGGREKASPGRHSQPGRTRFCSPALPTSPPCPRGPLLSPPPAGTGRLLSHLPASQRPWGGSPEPLLRPGRPPAWTLTSAVLQIQAPALPRPVPGTGLCTPATDLRWFRGRGLGASAKRRPSHAEPALRPPEQPPLPTRITRLPRRPPVTHTPRRGGLP